MRQMHSGAALDASSIAALYDRYAHNILNYISRYISSREDVDDIVLAAHCVSSASGKGYER
jgi:DNA-directed RNA polymerase specialized sigma24 family protein